MQGLLRKGPVMARSGRPSLLALTWVRALFVGGALHVMLCSLSYLFFLNGAILGFAICLSCAAIRASFLLHSWLFNITQFLLPLHHAHLASAINGVLLTLYLFRSRATLISDVSKARWLYERMLPFCFHILRVVIAAFVTMRLITWFIQGIQVSFFLRDRLLDLGNLARFLTVVSLVVRELDIVVVILFLDPLRAAT